MPSQRKIISELYILDTMIFQDNEQMGDEYFFPTTFLPLQCWFLKYTCNDVLLHENLGYVAGETIYWDSNFMSPTMIHLSNVDSAISYFSMFAPMKEDMELQYNWKFLLHTLIKCIWLANPLTGMLKSINHESGGSKRGQIHRLELVCSGKKSSSNGGTKIEECLPMYQLGCSVRKWLWIHA